MQKWEYIVGSYALDEKQKKWFIKVKDDKYPDLNYMLTDMGNKGWELISVSTFIEYARTSGEYFYFKRPKE